MQVRHSGDTDVIECALRDIPRIAVKVELRALRLPPLTVRYVRLRAPLTHTRSETESVLCPVSPDNSDPHSFSDLQESTLEIWGEL